MSASDELAEMILREKKVEAYRKFNAELQEKTRTESSQVSTQDLLNKMADRLKEKQNQDEG